MPKEANHPCVIISPDWVCLNPDLPDVNVVTTTTHRALRPPRDTEFLLDREDGMDWETLVKLHIVWAVPKGELRLRKHVTAERRRPLGIKLVRVLGLVTPQPGEAGTKRQIKDQVARPDAMPALAPKLSSKTCSLFGREILKHPAP